MHLGLGVGVADLVQEDDAADGLLKDAAPVGVGAGKGPLLVAEQLGIGEIAGIGGNVGLLDRQFAPRIDLPAVEAVQVVVEVVEEKLLARTGGAGNQDRREPDGGLLEGAAVPGDDPVEERRRDRADELHHGLGSGAVADDVAQAVGGDVRVLVGHVAGQPVDLALEAFDALQVRDVPGGQRADDLQDTAVFFSEIVVVQGIEADHRDHLVVTDDRHGDLALQKIAHGAVEAAGLLLLLDPRDDLGLLGEGRVAGQASLPGRQLLPADQKRRDILLEPLLVLGADDVPGLVLHHHPSDPVPLADHGDAAGIRADQLGGLGKHLG